MKKLTLIIVILFSISFSYAQEQEKLSEKEKARRQHNIDIGNPFARFGYKPKIATLSKGKYLEFHDRDSIVKIGSFTYNTRQKRVTGFIDLDTVHSEATLRPELISRWFNPDPLSDEFPSWSPYTFVYNSPIIHIDPDGREGIVVSGQPGNHKNREHFLINGLAKAKAAMKHFKNKSEKVTWMVYNDGSKKAGYTAKTLTKYRKQAEKLGINFMVVSDTDDIVDYVNDKVGGDSREKDLISSFYYVGHSTPGDLDAGYGGSGENFEPDDFNEDAFASGTHVNLVGGCRTSISGFFEDSAVTQFQEILDNKSKVYGSNVRVYYSGGQISDSELVKKNNGKIIERNGELQEKKNNN